MTPTEESLRAKCAELRLENDDLRLQLECALSRIRDLEAGR